MKQNWNNGEKKHKNLEKKVATYTEGKVNRNVKTTAVEVFLYANFGLPFLHYY